MAVEETIGDAAYGDGGTRQAFADAGRTLIAKLPRRPDSKRFPKEDFEIDLESGACTCPAGHTTSKLYRMGTHGRAPSGASRVATVGMRDGGRAARALPALQGRWVRRPKGACAPGVRRRGGDEGD